jgi:hypothetical protein
MTSLPSAFAKPSTFVFDVIVSASGVVMFRPSPINAVECTRSAFTAIAAATLTGPSLVLADGASLPSVPLAYQYLGVGGTGDRNELETAAGHVGDDALLHRSVDGDRRAVQRRGTADIHFGLGRAVDHGAGNAWDRRSGGGDVRRD